MASHITAISEVLETIIDSIAEAMSPLEQGGLELEDSPGFITRERPYTCSKCDFEEQTCAICLEIVPDGEWATPVAVGCKHTYCVNCLVHWASTHSKEPRCPTCKMPFSKVMSCKKLDGTIVDGPVEESVSLMARAAWFQDWLCAHEHLKKLSKLKPGAVVDAQSQPVNRSDQALMQEEWAEEELYSYFEDLYDDYGVDHMYLQRAHGSRHAISNRPWGPNGFVAAGRKLAAPKRPPAGKGGKGKGSNVKQHMAGEAGPSSKSSNGSGGKKVTGRRALRKARRAAVDAA